MDIFIPVMEAAMIYASHYCKACGRSTVTSKDLEYGMKYSARTTTGNKIGSFFPEIYEEDSDSDGSQNSDGSLEIVDDSDEPFTRYEGTEELYVKINEAYDTWESWEPEIPAEEIIKNAIDNGGLHR